jgi:hypothetical protein
VKLLLGSEENGKNNKKELQQTKKLRLQVQLRFVPFSDSIRQSQVHFPSVAFAFFLHEPAYGVSHPGFLAVSSHHSYANLIKFLFKETLTYL